jgi:hypothetical protein
MGQPKEPLISPSDYVMITKLPQCCSHTRFIINMIMLHVWRLAAVVLNKSRTAATGDPAARELRGKLKTLLLLSIFSLCLFQASDFF